MRDLKEGAWVHDLVEVYNDLGGVAAYQDVYPLARKRREARGASWTAEAHASIRRTVEDHAASSKNFRGQEVFFSVNGHGKGVWGLMPEYLRPAEQARDEGPAYLEGLEGLVRERGYLARTRDPRLVEARKLLDDYTCQACGFRLEVGEENYIIDVHHLLPLGGLQDVRITSVNDLVCLCPTCHRIAHTAKTRPLALEEVSRLSASAAKIL